jgi:hypothetical protein
MPGPLRNLLAGMIISGTATYNQEQQEHGSREQLSVLKYLSTGDFVEATFENWESECQRGRKLTPFRRLDTGSVFRRRGH